MPSSAVHFFTEDINFTLKDKRIIKAWIKATIAAESYELEELNFIFCSDEYLLRINQDYLNHDTYTDVITFDNSEGFKIITGDIFISIDRIKENAKDLDVPVTQELCRVMIHGTLHLLGYLDKKKADKALMTSKEDHYLAQLAVV
jgi:probable rRNA maturation factor